MEDIDSVRGVVKRGDGMAGKEFNLPTANLYIDQWPEVPPGVYAAHAFYDETEYEAIVSIMEKDKKFEVHLFDFAGDLYGESIRVKLLYKVSEIIPWVTVERMRQKIQHDVELVHGYFSIKK